MTAPIRLASLVAGALQLLALTAMAAEPTRVAACATPAQTDQVRAFYQAAETPPATFQATRPLGLPEGIIASALPPQQAMGVPGRHFRQIWASLLDWGNVTLLIMKGGNVFEIQGPVHPGKDSTTSRFFNLEYGVGGAGGHLRPDLLASIYAIAFSSSKGNMRGVAFYDAAGDSPFAVYMREEGPLEEERQAAFQKTWDLMAQMERACP